MKRAVGAIALATAALAVPSWAQQAPPQVP
jgi:hypothetical protein